MMCLVGLGSWVQDMVVMIFAMIMCASQYSLQEWGSRWNQLWVVLSHRLLMTVAIAACGAMVCTAADTGGRWPWRVFASAMGAVLVLMATKEPSVERTEFVCIVVVCQVTLHVAWVLAKALAARTYDWCCARRCSCPQDAIVYEFNDDGVRVNYKDVSKKDFKAWCLAQ